MKRKMNLRKRSVNQILYRIMVLFLVPAIILTGLSGCAGTGHKDNPLNIVLLIGDGMGTNQIYAGMIANGGKLNLESCEYVGFQKTYCTDRDITDSGASATALATGVKTNYHAVGLDPDGNVLKTIVDYAQERGMSTGLLATLTITDATPACFAAHNTDRYRYEEIAEDISISGIDLLIGGGSNHFNRRKDGRNLLDTLISRGYYVGDRLDNIPDDHEGPVAILADTLALPTADMGRGDFLPLATAMAIKRLSTNPEGFFLMVEGSQIDKAAHKNMTERMIAEVLDFDKAIGEALKFADLNGETLVIVTADHETGGFTILKGGPLRQEVKGAFSTKGHTGVMVPVFASGPGADKFSGIYENTEIFYKMKNLLGL